MLRAQSVTKHQVRRLIPKHRSKFDSWLLIYNLECVAIHSRPPILHYLWETQGEGLPQQGATPGFTLREWQAPAKGSDNPKHTTQTLCVTNCAVDALPSCQLVALPVYVEAHAEALGREKNLSVRRWEAAGTKLENACVCEVPSRHAPDTVGLQGVHREIVEVGARIREGLAYFERRESLNELGLLKRSHDRE